MKKLYNKVSYDMKVVRDTFHSLSIGQKIWLIICIISTVLIILKAVNKVTRKILDKIEFIKFKNLDYDIKAKNQNQEEDYSDKCPDECSDPFDDYDDEDYI